MTTSLDFAGFDVGIARVFAAQLHQPGDGHDVFAAQGFGAFVQRGIGFVVEDDLGDAGAVTQVDENDAAEVAAAVNPAHEGGGFAGIGGAEFSAAMCALEIT